MSTPQKSYYANSYLLVSYIQSQQSIPKHYNSRSYLGECMLIQEKQNALFLSEFVNDIAVILPEHYDLMESLLFTLKSSEYKPIKKLLPQAIKKFNIMKHILSERQIAANSVKPMLNQTNTNRFNILENKRKMLLMSCSDLCALGEAIKAERGFNTTKIQNKFYAFVNYRIELVLSGKLPIDPDFKVLLKKYGTVHQSDLYKKIIENKVSSYTPVQMQPLDNSVSYVPQKKTNIKSKPQQMSRPVAPARTITHTVRTPRAETTVTQRDATSDKKKPNVGFFKKIGRSVKNVFNKVKKPLLIGGIFALSLFGGKRAYDAAIESKNESVRTEIHTDNTTPVKKEPILNLSDSLYINNQQTIRNNKTTETPTNNVIKKAVAQLQYLKATNPTDRNMNVDQTAKTLYQKFGNDAPKVILASAMAPYALNDYTKFDFRPSTHNMVEYLTSHELTAAQRNALDTFIAKYVKNNSINMNDFAAYNVNQIRQNQR